MKKKNITCWWVVLTGFFLFFTIYAIAYNCYGLFLEPMSTDFNVSTTTITGLFSISSIISMIAGVVYGRVFDKFDMRIPVAAACVCVGGAMLIFATTHSVGILYLGAAIEGIGLAGATSMAVSALINGWFAERKGLALGIALAGSGVGGTVFAQVIAAIIQSSGWRSAYMVCGILTLVLTVPFVLIFGTQHPEKKGCTPYGAKTSDDAEPEKVNTTSEAGAKISSEDSAKTKKPGLGKTVFSLEFWLFFLGFGFVTIIVTSVKGHIPNYLVSLGYDYQVGANALSIAVLMLIPGKPFLGWCFDKLGSVKGILISVGALIVGTLLMLFCPMAGFFVIAFAVIYGFGTAFASVGYTAALYDIFKGNENFATVYALCGFGAGVGSAIGPTITAVAFDALGSYHSIWIVCAVCGFIGLIFMLAAVKIAHRKQKAKEAEKVEADVVTA